MTTFSQFFTQTPLWVYVLFFYLLFIGIKSLKTRVVSLTKLFFVPIIFFIMSITTLVSSVHITTLSVTIYIASLLLGSFLGWLFVKNKVMKFDKKHHLVQLQGSWTTLVLILAIFCIKYYFGYAISVDPEKAHSATFNSFRLLASGIVTGIFLGRSLFYLHSRRKAPHTSLK